MRLLPSPSSLWACSVIARAVLCCLPLPPDFSCWASTLRLLPGRAMYIPRRCGRLRLAGRLALDESAQSLAHLLAADYSRMVGVLTISYWELRFRVSRSEEHTSELQSLMRSSYAVFCLKKQKKNNTVYTCT